jgi:uncharacterized protein (DUF58 family)
MILAAGLVCFLAQKNGDLVGLVAGEQEHPQQLPARSSDGHLELVLRTIQSATTPTSAASDSSWLLERAFRVTSRSTLMTIITDEAHPTPEDFPILRRLTTRHDVMIIRIGDGDPLQADQLGREVIDVDVRRELSEYARASKKVEAEVAQYARQRRDQISQMLDRLHITHVLTAGESTVVDDMVAMLREREYRHAHA